MGSRVLGWSEDEGVVDCAPKLLNVGKGAIKSDFDMLEEGGFTSLEMRARASTRIAMRTTGQKSSQREAPSVRFHTIQFFFIRAQKWRVL
jgi:hypothetical protein